MNDKLKNAIQKFIDRNIDQISLIRIIAGSTTKADTIALYTTNEEYMPNGDHAVITIEPIDLTNAICDVLDENGYGSILSYMRIYAYNNEGKQFSTMQRTCNPDEERKPVSEQQQIAPIVNPLVNGIIKILDQMMKANETLSNSLAHSQDAQLRLMDGILEAKEEGIDYQALALQTQMILENMQAPPEEDNEIGEKLLNVLSMGMGGMAMPQSQPTEEPANDHATPTKEQMKAWAKQDPSFIGRTFEAYKEFQSENNNTTKNPQKGENHE